MSTTIDEINKLLATGNALAPAIIGLIAMLRQSGDTRTPNEILAEALSTTEATAALTAQDMKDE